MQTLVFGIFAGAIYGIAAMGLALVFGVLKILNIAHGELVMLGGYVGFWAFSASGARSVPVPASSSSPRYSSSGLILDRVVYRHIVRLLGEEKLKNSLLVSFGLGLVLQNLAQALFTGDERSVQVSYAGEGSQYRGRAVALHASGDAGHRADHHAGPALLPSQDLSGQGHPRDCGGL